MVKHNTIPFLSDSAHFMWFCVLTYQNSGSSSHIVAYVRLFVTFVTNVFEKVLDIVNSY